MPPWTVWTALGPSGPGLRACGQSCFRMKQAADIAYDDAVPLYICSGFIFHEQNLDALSRTFVGAAAQRGSKGVIDLLVCQYRARAASNSALWSDACALAMALVLAQPVRAYLLALIAALRWKDDVEMRCNRPWNVYLCEVDGYAKTIISRYSRVPLDVTVLASADETM